MRSPNRLAGSLLLLLLPLALMGSRIAAAAEVRVFHPAALRSIVDALAPQFERETGHTLAATVDFPTALKRRIDAGEPFDVAVLNPDHIEELITSGKIVSATRVDFARAGVGVGVRAGAPRPEIGTVAAFKAALLKAKSVVYAQEGPSGVHFARMLTRMGIAQEMETRLRPMGAGRTTQPVATGEADLVVVNMASILAASGVDLIGPVPEELQAWITFTAGVSSAATQSEASRAFAQYLKTPSAVAVIKAKGMEPLAR